MTDNNFNSITNNDCNLDNSNNGLNLSNNKSFYSEKGYKEENKKKLMRNFDRKLIKKIENLIKNK